MNKTFGSILAICFLSSILCLLFSDEEAPLTPDAIKAAEKLVEEIFEDKLNARRPDEIKAAAAELLKEAQNTKDDRAAKYVLLLKSLELASKVNDVETVLTVLDGLKEFGGKELTEKRNDILKTMAKRTREKDDLLTLVSVYSDIATVHEAKSEYEEAGDALKTAYSLAKKARDKELALEISNRKKAIDALEKEFRYTKKALATLEKDPENGKANLTAGRFYCFVTGDWDKGLPYLSQSSEAALADLAKKDIELLKLVEKDEVWGPEDIVKLADGWLEAAEDERDKTAKGNMASRASLWYSEAMGRLSRLKQKAIEKKMLEADKLAALAGGSSAGVLPRGALAVFTFEKDSIGTVRKLEAIKDLTGNGYDRPLAEADFRPGRAGDCLQLKKAIPATKFVSWWFPKDILEVEVPLTFSFWMKYDKLPDKPGYRTHQLIGGPYRDGISIGSKNSIQVQISDGTNATSRALLISKADTVTSGKWIHVCAVLAGPKGKELTEENAKIFIDGKQVETSRIKGTFHTWNFDYFSFGAIPHFGGALDEVAIFKRALSEKEIKGLYVMGKSGKILMKAK